jgi:hypothetical protein
MLDAIAGAQAAGFRGAPPRDVAAELGKLAALGGRPLFFDYLGAGLGRGSRAMLADGRWLLDFTSVSASICMARFASSGAALLPCAVPTSNGIRFPSSSMPAFSHFWMSRTTRLFAIRCSTNFTSRCGTVQFIRYQAAPEDAEPLSNRQLRPYAAYCHIRV